MIEYLNIISKGSRIRSNSQDKGKLRLTGKLRRMNLPMRGSKGVTVFVWGQMVAAFFEELYCVFAVLRMSLWCR